MKQKFMLCYPKKRIKEPTMYYVVKHFDVIPNIFRAKVTENQEGFMVVELEGEEKNIAESIAYLKSLGVKVDTFEKGIRLNKDKCTSCGLCVSNCPAGALHIPDRKTMQVEFDSDKCIECRACILVCPFGAIEDVLNDNQDATI